MLSTRKIADTSVVVDVSQWRHARRTAPILFQMSEFQHNCLEDAMADWHCISMSESSFRALTAPASTAIQTADGTTAQDCMHTIGLKRAQILEVVS
eukprot:5090817-Amphidinium_carterae.1